MTTQEAIERWLAANAARAAYRAAHGEESPEYKQLADESNYWLFELLALERSCIGGMTP